MQHVVVADDRRALVGWIGAAAVALAVGGALLTAGNQVFTWSEIAIAFGYGAVGTVVAIALVHWATKGGVSTSRAALVAGIVALFATPLLWFSGAPIALGAAAFTLGRAGQSRSRATHVAVVLGALAAIATTGVLLVAIVGEFGPGLPR